MAWRSRIGLALLAFAGLVAALAISAGTAAARTIPGAITRVTVTPTNPNINDPVTVNMNWCVPDGSHPGDTFTLGLPGQLTPFTSGFPLKNSAGDVVATATVTNGVATFTLTSFVSTHLHVCGTAYFNESIDKSKVPVNKPAKLTFSSGSATFNSTITPTVGTGPSHTGPVKYGAWVDKGDQGRTHPKDALYWFIDSPLAPSSGDTKVVFTDTATAGQQFDCAKLAVQIGTFTSTGDFASQGSYTGSVTKACTVSALTVTTGAVPAGRALHLLVPVTITNSALQSYSDTAGVAVDGRPSTSVTAENVVRYAAGGNASGIIPSGSPSSTVAPPSSSPSVIATSTAHSSESGLAFTQGSPTVQSSIEALQELAFTGVSTEATTLAAVGLLALGGLLLLVSGQLRKAFAKGRHS
jgi:hypothetical protein